MPGNTFSRSRKAAPRCTASPSLIHEVSSASLNNNNNSQKRPTSTLYPRAGCDGNWEHVLRWVSVAISSSHPLPEEQPASSLASKPVSRRYWDPPGTPPLFSMFMHWHIWRGRTLEWTLILVCDVFLLLRLHPCLFMPSLLFSAHPSTAEGGWEGGWGDTSKQQQTNRVVVVFVVSGGGVKMSLHVHPLSELACQTRSRCEPGHSKTHTSK